VQVFFFLFPKIAWLATTIDRIHVAHPGDCAGFFFLFAKIEWLATTIGRIHVAYRGDSAAHLILEIVASISEVS
jgi:hypothetical protein